MRVLFICRANVGRSQMAAALFSSGHPGDFAASAGTVVDRPGETLQQYRHRNPGHSFVIEAMDEIGIDVRGAIRQQVYTSVAIGIDVVVSMAERETEPAWLSGDARYVHWEIPDPGGRSLYAVRRAREQILQRIEREFGTSEATAA